MSTLLKISPTAQAGAAPTPQATKLTGAARWALAALSLSMLMPSLDTSIANVNLPVLAHAFGASFQAVQWIVLAYLLAITTLIVSVGRLGDLFGRRRLLLWGIVLFTATSLFCGVAPNLWLLIGARAAQGLGAAIMMALTVAMVGETIPKAKTGSAMGLLGTMSAIGTALGPSLGGLLTAGFGWRMIFLVNVPLGIINVLLARRYLPRPQQAAKAMRPTFDKLGTLLLALTLGAYALAVTMGGDHLDRLNIALLAGAALGAVLFLIAEARVKSPLVKLVMLRDPILSGSLAMSVAVACVMMTTFVVGPFYLARSLGLSTALVGLVMSTGPVISAFTGIPAGRIVDKLGAPRVVFIGLIEMVLGLAGLTFLPLLFGVPGYIASIALLTPGYQLFQAANNTVIMTDVRADQRGVVSGMLSLSRNLGLITGAAVMGAIFAAAAAVADITTAQPEAVATGMRITFTVTALLIVGAIVIATISRTAIARRAVPGDIS
ncbi:MAG TPA: MFS transporter [Dongiaceae bacterium]|nr:MFS transporter [Dongiaceae bacterium]